VASRWPDWRYTSDRRDEKKGNAMPDLIKGMHENIEKALEDAFAKFAQELTSLESDAEPETTAQDTCEDYRRDEIIDALADFVLRVSKGEAEQSWRSGGATAKEIEVLPMVARVVFDELSTL
jgi:hypothetical protein